MESNGNTLFGPLSGMNLKFSFYYQFQCFVFWQIKGHNSKMEKAVESKIELGPPFMVPDLVYKLQMIFIREILSY